MRSYSYPRRGNLRGRVVVITGASSGNGRAAAHAFAREGASVVLAARRQAVLGEVVRECEDLGGQAIAIPTDVSEADQVEALAGAAVAAFGRIDVWVNCAAVLQYGRFDETPREAVEQVIRVNLFGYFNGARAAIRRFRAQGNGVLINVSSILGLFGHPYTAAYGASKFAILGLTASLRQEVQDEPDIHVAEVLPAAIDTPIYRRAANYTGREIRPIRPIYSPQTVAGQIVGLARAPRRRAYAGGFARMSALGSVIAPATSERLVRVAADIMELAQTERPASAGNLFAPVTDGYAVEGGWRVARFAGWTTASLVAGAGLLAMAVVRRARRA